jgi:tripartite-type tricarboxylate transporter receptor subunit TctC
VPGYEASTWNGIVGPVGVPPAIVAKLNGEINKALVSTTVRERFAAIGAEPAPVTPEQFGHLIRTEYVKWADVVKRSGARID